MVDCMISNFHDLPNLVACQYMDRQMIRNLDALIGKWLGESDRLQHQEALRIAKKEYDEYEDWLCQQERIDPASWAFDEDVAW